jgi:Helix-turn-helix family
VTITPEQAAHDTRDALLRVPGRFMADPATYAKATDLGFRGADFYVAGRGSVLGEVPASVVTAALVFFSPDVVEPAWERSATVLSRRETAQAWAACLHDDARKRPDDEVDWEALATSLGRVVAFAPVAGAPLFAGWRELPEPDDERALALHRLNALRELRGALHGAAVLTVGLAPVEALVVRTPTMISTFGWTEAPPDASPFNERWALAEARTDRMFGRHLGVLDGDERSALVEMLGTLAS